MRMLIYVFGALFCLTQFFCNADSIESKVSKNTKKQVYIVHGFAANPSKHWFKWLESELEKDKNVSVKILNLPNSEKPNLQEWLNELKKEVKNVDSNTYFVGHSLGCITILRYVASLDSKIGGVILVSGFYEKLKILPQLDSFVTPTLDFNKIINLVQNRVVISARNDEIVPSILSNNLADKLQATFIQTANGKHFMDREGVDKMPLVLLLLRNYFSGNSL